MTIWEPVQRRGHLNTNCYENYEHILNSIHPKDEQSEGRTCTYLCARYSRCQARGNFAQASINMLSFKHLNLKQKIPIRSPCLEIILQLRSVATRHTLLSIYSVERWELPVAYLLALKHKLGLV